jgi:hypothetical protein
MKKLTFKISLAILATCSAIFVKPQSASAQIDMSLLTEVAKSCQKDSLSLKYYKQMGFDDDKLQVVKDSNVGLIYNCIYYRYFHSLIQSKFSWVALTTDEIIPGYPGSVVVSLLSLRPRSSLLDCIVSQDPSSQVCEGRKVFNGYVVEQKIVNDNLYEHHTDHYTNNYTALLYIHICPSCVIAHDNILSSEKTMGGFIQWFLRLDKPRRREIMSILGNEQEQINNRQKIQQEASRAVAEYIEIREKVKQQEENRRRREVLGN